MTKLTISEEKAKILNKIKELNKKIMKLDEKANEWDKVLTAYKESGVKDFTTLSTYISSLGASGTQEQGLLEKEREKCEGKIKELKDQHALKVKILKDQLERYEKKEKALVVIAKKALEALKWPLGVMYEKMG